MPPMLPRCRWTVRCSSRRPANWSRWPSRRSSREARWRWRASISATSRTLDYQRHLFRERTLTSVTANTRADGEEFLRLAAAVGIAPQVTAYAFQDADRALDDLAKGALTGAAVLHVS